MSFEVLNGVVSQFDRKSFKGTVSVDERKYHFDRSCVRRNLDLQKGAAVTVLVSRDNLLEIRSQAGTRVDVSDLRNGQLRDLLGAR